MLSSSLSYTGKAVKQTKFKLLNNGNELTEGEDYTVKYANNVKIGTASMTITGIGKYTGSATLKFKILTAKPVVSVSKVTDSTVTLKWRAVTGAKYYSVYEYNAKTKKYTGVFLKTTGTTYTAKKKAAGTKYFYIVRAFDSTYNYGSAFTTADLVSAITLCKAPTITGIAGSKGRLAIKWSSCTGAYYYNVYRYNRATKKYTLVNKTTATAFSMAAKKGTYYFLVRAYNANSVGSAFTTKNIVRVTVK